MSTSLEKVEQLKEQVLDAPALDGPMVMLQAAFVQFLPYLSDLIPKDAAALDAGLEQVGQFVLGLRSDPEPPPALDEGDRGRDDGAVFSEAGELGA